MNDTIDPLSSEALWDKHKDVVLAYQKALKTKKKKKKQQHQHQGGTIGIVTFD